MKSLISIFVIIALAFTVNGKSLLIGETNNTGFDFVELELDSIFPIGTKWTYEWKEYAYPTFISYVEFEIIDTVRSNDSLIYIIENNRTHPEIRMYQESDKVYLFDPFTNDWQLTYEFTSTDAYDTNYYDPYDDSVKSTTVAVTVDSNFSIELGDRGKTIVQQLTIMENGSTDIPLNFDIVKNVGKMTGGLSLELGQGLHDPPYYIGDIRCFESGQFSFNFSSSSPGELTPCDLEKHISSISEPISERFDIYPNPAFDKLFIRNRSETFSGYTIYGVDGILLDEGSFKDVIDVSQLPKGWLVLKISGPTSQTSRILKL